MVVLERVGHTLPHRLVGSEMNGPVDGPLPLEHALHGGLVAAVDAMNGRLPAHDACDAINGALLAVAQVVHNDGLEARSGQFHAGMRSDESGTTGYENLLHCGGEIGEKGADSIS